MKTWIIVGLVIVAALAAAFLLPDGTSEQDKIVDENINDIQTPDGAEDQIEIVDENINDTKMPTNIDDFSNKTVTLKTSEGDIDLVFYPEDAPKAVENFIRLAESGYYDGVTFHRVVRDFVIQAGDPTGSGSGGESIFGGDFEDELDPSTVSYQAGYKKGVLAMANRGPNTNSSQFFIILADNPLPHLYTIFGEVKSGIKVVDEIGQVAVNSGDKPLEDVIIEKAVVK